MPKLTKRTVETLAATDMPINKTHFNCLRRISTNEQKWVGANVADWWCRAFSERNPNLPNKKLSRKELKALCAENSGFTDAEAFAAVMAWGGMRRDHGRLVKTRIDAVSGIIGRLRNGVLSRSQAFSEFHNLRTAKILPGMTAAYFTKLIFFCPRRHDGYIMDQWTSKSINLLFGDEVVDLSKAGFVTDKNDAERYEHFCKCIEQLGRHAGWDPEETEVRLFSEGRKKGAWRNYVIANWR